MRTTLSIIMIYQGFCIIVAWVIYLYILFKGRFWLKEKLPDFYKDNGKIIVVVRIVAGMALTYMIFYQIIPDIKDIPYLMNEEYCQISGEAVSNSMGGGNGIRTRSVNIETDDGEVIHIAIYGECDDIQEGDYLTAKYLLNSKRGTIIRHIRGEQ